MGTPLGPKYIPYTYMDPLGKAMAHLEPGDNERRQVQLALEQHGKERPRIDERDFSSSACGCC